MKRRLRPGPMLERAIDWLVPVRCAGCGMRLEQSHRLLCRECAAVTRAAPGARVFESGFLFASDRYEGPIARAITNFKYNHRPELARRFAQRIALESAGAEWRSFVDVVLVPVPLHPHRLAERGFNQSALLASTLAARFGWSCSARVLRRTHPTARQAMLSREQRLFNLIGHIHCVPDPPRRVVLVDDVFTTGATARACYAAFRALGIEPLGLIVIAVSER